MIRRIPLIAVLLLAPGCALAASRLPLVLNGSQTQQLRSADNLTLPNITGSTQCVHADTSGNLTGTGANCGTGTVTTTGSPASGNIAKFSGSTSITNGDLSGDVTTSGALVTAIKNDVALGGNPTTTTQSAGNNSTRVATTAYADAAAATAVGGGAFTGGSWFSTQMQRMTYWVTNTGATTFFGLGDTITAYGTAGGSGGTTHVGITLNSSGSASGYRGVANYLINGSIKAYWAYNIDGIVNVRLWMGISSGTSFGSASPATSYVGFRFDTSASDTHWQCASGDGSNQTLVDSGITPDTATHDFAIVANAAGTSVDCYIDGAKVGTITTHLPSGVTGLRNIYEATALTATVRIVAFGSSYIFQDAKK